MKLFARVLSCLAVFSAFCVPHFASATTITFGSLTGVNGSNFTTYTEAGYTVTNSAGQFFVGTVFGDPIPDLYAGPTNGGPTADAIVITKAGGGAFYFDSFDGAATTGATGYEVQGRLLGSIVYDVTGGIANGAGFLTKDPGEELQLVTAVYIGYSIGGSSANLDNIVVSPFVAATPEPSGLVLLATGLVSTATMMRRRMRA